MSARLFRKPGSLVWWSSTTDDSGRTTERSTGHVNLDAASSSVDNTATTSPPPARPAAHKKTPAAYIVNAALVDFLDFGELNRSAATIACYEAKSGHLVRLVGDVALDALHVDTVHGYCRTRLDEGAARESVRKELCVLRQTLQLARDRGLFARDPAAVIPRFRARYTPRRRFLTEEEFDLLLGQLEPERQRWITICVCTGGRLSEMEAVQWGDIDWKQRLIHLRGTKTKTADRFVPLHRPLAEALEPLRGPDSDLLAGRWPNARRDLARACLRAKIERVSPNDLRRTFASWLKQAETDSMAVAKLLGHTSSRMVELVYGHLNQRTLEEAVARLPITSRRAPITARPAVRSASKRQRSPLH